VLVNVPEAEPVVGRWRLEHTLDARLGIPAHVTLLSPFVSSNRVDEARPRLAELVAATPAFTAAFPRTDRFPGVLYLAPEPAAPFAALTEAIAAAWPEHPPYEGAHETVVPHLTVAESQADEALLDRIATEVEPRLPLATVVRVASVFVEDERGRWHEHARLPLGEAP
jgi:2'-5' RNA ligase